MLFSNSLIKWYLQFGRDLPWRKTRDPYVIWLSEIILQQTRVAQGLPYFLSFLKAFPTVRELADAEEKEVLKLWQGLGYYSRARNLHYTAKKIAYESEGKFPDSFKDLLKLKGVGEYTAAAIASFCYFEPVPVVDGNVFRVLSRFYGIETDISASKAKNEFTALADLVMDKKRPDLFNQAIMEFGALHCVPKNPDCRACILADKCVANAEGRVDRLPVKNKKNKVRNRFFEYVIFQDPYEKTLITKREKKGIWQNLYEFPLLESEMLKDSFVVEAEIEEKYFAFNIEDIKLLTADPILHKLSHQHLYIRFWKIEIKRNLDNGVSLLGLKDYPFPIVIYNFIQDNLLIFS